MRERGQVGSKQSHLWAQLWPTVLAMGAVLMVLQGGAQWRQSLQDRAEKETLQPILSRLGLPETTSKEEIYTCLAVHTADHEEARKARIAKQIGLYMDWQQIFDHIAHMPPSQQESILQVIAQEYSLSPTLSLEEMNKAVFLRSQIPPVKLTLQFRPSAL